MMAEPLVGHHTVDACLAWRAGVPITAGRFTAEVIALARNFPPSQYVLNSCRDRYLFSVGFGAALVAGRATLLPPSHAPETIAHLALRYPDILYLGEDAGRIVLHSADTAAREWCSVNDAPIWPPPEIGRDHVAAIAFTSGSTGEPQPNSKTWGSVVDGARAETIALQLDDAPIDDVVIVGTVAAQHMYGFESTVLMALHGPCAFAADHPLHPDELCAVLLRVKGRRVLVTAPVHLRALIEAAHAMPSIDRIVSATAPLALDLAQRCESVWNTRVFEIYGCTETGMVATRRTVDGPVWTTMRGVTVEHRNGEFHASGGHVQPGRLADRLRLISDSTFELEGRADDVVNIGGKRASLQGLNRVLLSIDGVVDGVIFEPPGGAGANREPRLMALVVAPDVDRATLVASLRAQVDAAFLPRPLVWVDALPRNAQGKLPRSELLALADKALRRRRSQPNADGAVARVGDSRIGNPD